MILRGYQDAATDAVIDGLKRAINPAVSAATGTGKSVCIASLCKRLMEANEGIRICVATHVSELVEQNAGKLSVMVPGADIGICSAGLSRRDLHNQILFAGIQSIYRADPGKIAVLIVDEAHTISRKEKSMWAEFIATLKANNPNLKIVGYSATTFRMDSGSLVEGDDAMFDEIVFDYGLGKAVDDGYLVPLSTKATETVYNIEGVGKVAGEYNLGQLEAATNLDHLTQKAVAEIIERGKGRRSWLIFCNGINHSFAVRDELIRCGISCATVTGETGDAERERILREFKSGELRAVTNNAVWTTGIDVPSVDLIGMLRHTMSGGLLLQMAGRGTRAVIDLHHPTAKERREAIAASSKPNCLFLDFAGNIKRHGFLDLIGPKSKGKSEGVAPMKDCPQCFTICHAAARSCPDCGHVFESQEKEKLGAAHDGEVLSQVFTRPEWREVVDVAYDPWNVTRKGKIPSLRVKYFHPDGKSTAEWICLWHGGAVGKKAQKWWDERETVSFDESPNGPVELVEGGYCQYLKVPRRIYVGKQDKFDRILKYEDLIPRHELVSGGNEASTDDMDWEIAF